MRIGIFGGVFDPVHEGHISVANAAIQAGLDQIILLPGPQKTDMRQAVASPAERVKMCRLAAQTDARITVSALEADQLHAVATIDTVRRLTKELHGAQLTILLGTDKLPGLPYWDEAKKLFELCDFLIAPRAGVDHAFALEKARQAGARVEMLDAKVTPGSSVVIRAQIEKMDEPDNLPLSVAVYIAQNGLYHDQALLSVRERMSEKRFQHTLGVRYEAVRLAALHRIPLQKAALAAMLHDCAKGLPFEEMLSLAAQAGITDENLLSSPALLHGPVGAYIAKTRLHVLDEDVLNAVANHTVGREGMSPLELCIFVADATEPNRDVYPGLERMRALADISLEAAALLSLNLTRAYLFSRGKTFNPLSDLTARFLTDRVPRELLYLTRAATQ